MRRSALLGVVLLGCGTAPDGEAPLGPVERVVQAALTEQVSASPNTCLAQPGSVFCETTLTWTKADAAAAYQLWVRQDNLPWGYMACTPPNGTDLSESTPWIQAGHDYDFSLRTAVDCVANPAAPEVGALKGVRGTTARITANGMEGDVALPVPAGGAASATISWLTSNYGHPAYGVYAVVWSTAFDGEQWLFGQVPQNFACNQPDQAPGRSDVAPWILEGHTYRFSLRVCSPVRLNPDRSLYSGIPVPDPSCQSCSQAAASFPEVAAVTVRGYREHIEASPAACSVAPGGTCKATLRWDTSSALAKHRLWLSVDGAPVTPVVCLDSDAKPGDMQTRLTAAMTPGRSYRYYLQPAATCTTPFVSSSASAETRAQSAFLVRDGTELKIAGQRLKALSMNKYELLEQYIIKGDLADFNNSIPVTCEDPDPAPGVLEQEAEAAMTDAAAHGFQYLRVRGSPFHASWMGLWRDCPQKYWSLYDRMVSFAAAQGYPGGQVQGLKLVINILWNFSAFSALGGVDVASMIKERRTCPELLANPAVGNQGKRLACQYVSELVQRYKDDPTIQIWEITNELDLDENVGSSSADRFGTDDTVEFVRTMAAAIRSCVPDGQGGYFGGCDKNHLISAGYAAPRPHAAHLRAQPEWTNGWYSSFRDDQAMMEAHVRYLNPDPIEIVSMHVYNGYLDRAFPEVGRSNEIMGLQGTHNVDAYYYWTRAARRAGKPFFLGEMGDEWADDSERDPLRPFGRASIRKLVDQRVSLWAPWSWHNQTNLDHYNIEPGLDDEYIAMLKGFGALQNVTTTSMEASPWNADFEGDANSDGIADFWTATGPVTYPTESWGGKAARLAPASGGAVTLDSGVLPLGFKPPSSAKLAATVAARSDVSITAATMTVTAYATTDGTGTPVRTLSMSVIDADRASFKVRYAKSGANAYVGLPATARSLKVRLSATGNGAAVFDDVRVTVAY